MTASDKDWLAVAGNLHKAKKSWSCLSMIFLKVRGNSRVLGNFSKAVVQAVLLFETDMWVIIHCMGRTLGGFQHRVDQQTTGRQA